jgi:hypothetical protein
MDLIVGLPQRSGKPFAIDALIYEPLVVVLAAVPTHPVNHYFNVFGILLDGDKHKKGARKLAIGKDRIATRASWVFRQHHVQPSRDCRHAEARMGIAVLCLRDPSGTMLVTHDVHAAFYMRGLDESADFFICWHGASRFYLFASAVPRKTGRRFTVRGLIDKRSDAVAAGHSEERPLPNAYQ